MEAFKITETDLGAAQDTIADQIVEKKPTTRSQKTWNDKPRRNSIFDPFSRSWKKDILIKQKIKLYSSF